MKERILELLRSNNKEDIELGCVLAIKTYSYKELLDFHSLRVDYNGWTAFKYQGKEMLLNYGSVLVHEQGLKFWIYDKLIDLD